MEYLLDQNKQFENVTVVFWGGFDWQFFKPKID